MRNDIASERGQGGRQPQACRVHRAGHRGEAGSGKFLKHFTSKTYVTKENKLEEVKCVCSYGRIVKVMKLKGHESGSDGTERAHG